MKKIIKISLLTLLLILFSNRTYAQFDTISLKSFNLNGKVKKIKNYTYKAEDRLGIINNGQLLSLSKDYKFKYENTGVITNVNLDYNIEGKNTRNFDKGFAKVFLYKDKKIIKENDTIYASDQENVVLQRIPIYSTDGNLIKISEYRNNKIFRINNFEYDQNGFLTKSYTIDEDGEVTKNGDWVYKNTILFSERKYGDYPTQNNYTYDSSGKLIEHTLIIGFPDGNSFSYKKHYEYDRNNNNVKEIHFNDSVQTTVVDKIYHGLKLTEVTSMFTTKDNSQFQKIVTSYNQGKISKETSEDNEKTVIQEFDENENVIRLVYKLKNDQIDEYTYHYSFDDRKNWTQTIEFRNTVPLKIRIREIIYF